MQSVRVLRQALTLPPLLQELFPRQLSDAICRCGASRIEEIRLHGDRYATVTCSGKNISTGVSLRPSDMNELLKKMCGGSLYAYTQSINQGYITLADGIRVGVCGTAATEQERIIGVGEISGLIIRIPNRISVSPRPILSLLEEMQSLRGVLIYAPPGVGKTTLLRAAAVAAASGAGAKRTVVVDTREELAHALRGEALTLDVLIGYPRDIGIEIAVRSLGAELVICDEIGNLADANAVIRAANCGVPLLASAHAADAEELLRRPAFRALHRAAVFGAYVGITRSGSSDFCYRIKRWKELPHDCRG